MKKDLRLYGLLLGICFLNSNLRSHAQMRYEQLTITDGLPANHINTMFQDRMGFIWLTSTAGFARYDGHRFKTFRYDYKNNNSIKGNFIKNLQEDKDGNIWVFQHAGLSKLNTNNWQVQNYSFADSLRGKRYDWEVFSMTEVEGKLLVASSKGLRELDQQTNLLLPFSKQSSKDSINQFGASSFIDYDAHTLLIGTWQGLVVMNKQSGQYKRFQYPNKKIEGWPNPTVVTALYMDEHKTIWLGWWGGALTSFDMHSKTFDYFSPTVNSQQLKWLVAADIKKGREPNTLYITDRYQEAYAFNTLTKEWKNISPLKLQNTNATFHGMLIDKSGILWMGTSDGLFKADPNQQLFETHLVNAPTVPGADNGVISIYKDELDNNKLWYSGYNAGNLFCYDLKQRKRLPIPKPLQSLQNQLWEYYESFCRDNQNRLWISCGKGIYVWDEKNGQVSLFESGNKHKGQLNTQGNLLLKTKRHQIFAGGWENLALFNEQTQSFKNIFLADSVYSTEVFDLNEDAEGDVWVACVDQPRKAAIIRCVDSKTLAYKRYNHPVIQNCIYGTGKSLRCLYAKDKKHIYIGTNFGLFRGFVENDTLQLKQATTADGFFAGAVEHIKPENDSIIWLHSSDGVYRHNMFQNTYSRLGTPNGMLNNFPNSISAYNGQVFLGSQDGNFQALNTSFLNQQQPPAIFITGFKVNGNDFLLNGKDILGQKNIPISYKQDNVHFEFTALDYTNTSLQLFKYQLEGYDKDWISTSEPFAVYNNLPGGDYTFRVKACNSFGNWNEAGIAVKLKVAPPFWKTSWFIITCALLAGLALWLAYKRRVTRIKAAAALKQQRLEAELKALRSQMNPHFIFNCLNTIDAYILKNQREEASEILQQFSQLTRSILDNSRVETIEVQEEMNALMTYAQLEQTIMDHHFSTDFHIDEALQHANYSIPTMLLQPFVENAILHGLRQLTEKKGLLSIHASLVGSKILFTITDNGIGRQAASALAKNSGSHKVSHGIKMTTERIAILNNASKNKIRLQISENNHLQGSGTIVILEIPTDMHF
jgi:ligand-binding sensor domain-containing protein